MMPVAVLDSLDRAEARLRQIVAPGGNGTAIGEGSALDRAEQRLKEATAPPSTFDIVKSGLSVFRQAATANAPDPDRSVLGEAGAGLVRGVFGAIETGGGLSRLAATLGRKLTGDNIITQFLDDYGQISTDAAVAAKETLVPRSKGDDTFSLRNIAGSLGEAAPQLGQQVGLAIASGGASVPIQLGIFAGTAGAQVVGSQFNESLDYHIQQGLSPEEAADKAALESGTAGLITAATSAVPGLAILRKVPGGDKVLGSAAKSVLARLGAAGGAEGLQEASEQFLTEVTVAVERGTGVSQAVKDAFKPKELLFAATVGGLLGGGARGAIELAGLSSSRKPRNPTSRQTFKDAGLNVPRLEDRVTKVADAPPGITGPITAVPSTTQGETDGTARTQETQTEAPTTPEPAPQAAQEAGQEVAQPPVETVETTQPERPATSIKNVVVDQERTARGLPPAMEPARRSFGDIWDRAMRIVEESPNRQDTLVAELADKPRAVTDEEDALLLHRQVTLQNEYNKTLDRLDEAQAANDPAAIADQQSQEESLLQGLTQLYDINKAVGTETGRGLNARKLLAAEDFSLVQMLATKRKAKDVDRLSTEDEIAVKAQARKIQQLEQQLEEHTTRIDALEAEKASVQTTKDLVAAEPKAQVAKRTAATRKNLDDALDSFGKLLDSKLFANPLDPEILGGAAQVAKAAFNHGVATLQDFVAELTKRFGAARIGKIGNDTLQQAWQLVASEQKPKPRRQLQTPEAIGRHAHQLAKFFVSTGINERNALVDAVHGELQQTLPDITRRQAMDAISGFGNFTPLSQDEIDVTLRDLKGQLQQVAKLEEMQAGRAPAKTGQERRTPSDEERALIRQVNEAKRQGGFDVTDPETQLRSALESVKTRLRNQIADLEEQTRTGKKTVKTRTDVPLDAEAQTLTQRRNVLKEQFDAIFGRTELTDQQRLNAATSAVKKSIAELERRIKQRDVKPRKLVSKTKVTPTLQALRDQRDALKGELQQLKDQIDPKKTPEERALSAFKASQLRRIADFQGRLARKDFAPRKRKETKLDGEGERLRFKAEQAKAEFLKGLQADQRARRTRSQKLFGGIAEALNLSRSILTSMDFSALLRQAGFTAFSRPLRTARAIPDMFRSFKSKAVASQARNQLDRRPNAALYKRSGLELTDPEGRLSQQEEQFMSRLSKFIPGVAGSERAFIALLNRVRADSFDAMVATLGKRGTTTEAEAKVIANFVNVATGRGSLGRIKAAATQLATLFFAPRYVVSRFQLLTLQPLRAQGSTAQTRKLITAEYGRAIAGVGLVMSSAAAALFAALGPPGQDKEWNIELDPRSSDFMKIRIGDTRIDVLFGLQQATVFITRLITGKTKRLSTGEVVPIRGDDVPFGGSDAADVIARFLRTKLSPVVGTAVNLASGENVVGEPVTPLTTVRDLTVPISLRQIQDYMKDHGIPAGTALGLLEVFGMSVQNFPKFSAESLIKKIGDPPTKGTGKTQKRSEFDANIDEWIARLKKMNMPDTELIARFDAILQKKFPNKARTRASRMTAFKRRMGI